MRKMGILGMKLYFMENDQIDSQFARDLNKINRKL